MIVLRVFGVFVKDGIVKRRSPNKFRARSLIAEAEKRKRFLHEVYKKLALNDNNANYFIENSYDILIELLRARLLLDGFYASGKGAHEAEVSYMRKLGFSENEARFMNNLRYFRNGILYYGKDFDAEYGRKVLDFLEKIYPVLIGKTKKYDEKGLK